MELELLSPMMFLAIDTPMAAAPPALLPTPIPNAAAATCDSIDESLEAETKICPSVAVRRLSVTCASVVLLMVLMVSAPPPLTATPVCLAAATLTLAATASASMSELLCAETVILPLGVVTLESLTSATM